MCGIWAIFGSDHSLLQYFIPAYNAIHHRGPDAWRVENDHHFKNCCLGFHRLSIVDDMFGMQPMRIQSLPHLWVVCNGELYNCDRLRKEFDFKYSTSCDVEVILHLYAAGGIEFCVQNLDGVFSFCLLDTSKRKLFLARDTYGVRPSFRLTAACNGASSNDGRQFLAVCSEAKGLMELCKGLNGGQRGQDPVIEPIPPGHFEEYSVANDGGVTLLRRERFQAMGQMPRYKLAVPVEKLNPKDHLENVKTLLTAAVKKRLMAHRRIGCLLSGGLDSSLVAALLLRLAKEVELPYQVQTFAIGMEGSPDVLAARKVAKHIGSEHHEVIFTEQDVTNAVDKVIYHLESFDITTIRASIGMYLLSEYIGKNTDTIVIFSGEGADEVAQGYIYFRDAPTPSESDTESRRLISDLYMYDVLRGDRTTAAHGLELRVPFLDHQFVAYYLSLEAETRVPHGTQKLEKYLLRKAFDDGTDFLPNDILWRHKEAFSDGVASRKRSLFVILQEYAETMVTDSELREAKHSFPHVTPTTKEALYYRKVFERHFPGQGKWIPYFWMPRWTNGVTDPSARFLSHYAADDEEGAVKLINGAD